jgi:hypothetical protein
LMNVADELHDDVLISIETVLLEYIRLERRRSLSQQAQHALFMIFL